MLRISRTCDTCYKNLSEASKKKRGTNTPAEAAAFENALEISLLLRKWGELAKEVNVLL
jgi:hypothetical protein